MIGTRYGKNQTFRRAVESLLRRSRRQKKGSKVVTSGPKPIVEFSFSNPDRPGLGVEVLELAELKRRAPLDTLLRPHRLSFHQLTLVTRGRGSAMIDFAEYPIRRGTLLQVAPGQVQRVPYGASGRPADLNARMVLFAAAFPPPLATLTSITGPRFGTAVWTLSPPDAERIASSWTELRIEYTRAQQLKDFSEVTVDLLRQLLGTLLLRVARLPQPTPDPKPTPGREVFQRFQHELERSFAITHSVSAYANRLGYSPKTLARACQAATGHSPKHLIDARVVLEAKRLLAHSDLPVASIGLQLGFSEPTNFGKFFVHETNQTPGSFREQYA